MKRLLFFIIGLSFVWLMPAQQKPNLHGFTATTIEGKKVNLSKYAGKKLLIVNTASYCQYTYQYAALELLYANFKSYDFEILAFPSNDFGGQDPYSDSVIQTFCTNNFHITFPLMGKVNVATGDTSAVYRWLQEKRRNGVQDVSIAWNFGKFLINESGEWVRYYNSQTSPTDTAIVHWILSPSSTLGVKDNKGIQNGVQLLTPNPVADFIRLQFGSITPEPVQIKLFTVDGRLVNEHQRKAYAQGEILDYDVSGVEAGLYFLSLSNGHDNITFRILISPK